MEPLISPLVQFGGIGILAAVLLWIRQQDRAAADLQAVMFREEMKLERTMCLENNKSLVESIERLTERLIDEIRREREIAR